MSELRRLTMDTLMTYTGLTDKEVNQEIAETDLSKIAVLFDSVDNLYDEFNLSPAEKADGMQLRNFKGTEWSVINALQTWKMRYPDKATFKNLLIILLDNDKGFVAKDVAIYISNRSRHQQEPTNNQPMIEERKLDSTARSGDVSEVKSLLARGADPNHPECYPLHTACVDGYLEIVKALVEAGADTERRDGGGLSPVHCAALYGHKEVLVYLIRDRKCSANTSDKENNTPLHDACSRGHQDVVQYLVEKAHCDINPANNQGTTPLDLAKEGGYEDVVAYLKTRQESSPGQPGNIGESVVEVVEVTNKSKEFSNFGIKITVPENSLPEGIDTCVLHISFELSTDFEIPANFELFSSIYRVKCEPEVQFKKPLTLEIQHCASLSSDHQQRLVLARATRQRKTFEILEGGHFPIGQCYGSIQLTRFSRFGAFVRKLRGIPIVNERMYSALLFSRKNLPVIDIKCVVCLDLQTHVEVIRRELERDGFRKELERGQFQFDNEILIEMENQPDLRIITIQPSSTLSKVSIEGYLKVLFSKRRLGVIPNIHYTIKLEGKKDFSINVLLKNTNLDEKSCCLSIYIPVPQPPGNTETATQRAAEFEPKSDVIESINTPSSDDGSLSSERLQYSTAPARRVGTTIPSSAGDDSQVCNRRGPPANRVTLQELIRRYNLTDQQLNSEIEDSDTPKMALCFDDVQMYSSAMGLAIAEQADVNQSRGTQAAMMKCLQIWKEHDPSQATYRALLGIALRLGKGDTAHQICQQLTQHHTLD